MEAAVVEVEVETDDLQYISCTENLYRFSIAEDSSLSQPSVGRQVGRVVLERNSLAALSFEIIDPPAPFPIYEDQESPRAGPSSGSLAIFERCRPRLRAVSVNVRFPSFSFCLQNSPFAFKVLNTVTVASIRSVIYVGTQGSGFHAPFATAHW